MAEKFSFRQISLDEFQGGRLINTLCFKREAGELFRNFDAFFEERVDDPGIGRILIALFLTTSGKQFLVQQYLEYINPVTEIFSVDKAELNAEELEEILILLELGLKDLDWAHPKIKFQPYDLLRQDDNGHQFLIETLPCRADAELLLKKYEASLHKQTYWISKHKISD